MLARVLTCSHPLRITCPFRAGRIEGLKPLHALWRGGLLLFLPQSKEVTSIQLSVPPP
jgi:hypothetical protein